MTGVGYALSRFVWLISGIFDKLCLHSLSFCIILGDLWSVPPCVLWENLLMDSGSAPRVEFSFLLYMASSTFLHSDALTVSGFLEFKFYSLLGSDVNYLLWISPRCLFFSFSFPCNCMRLLEEKSELPRYGTRS